MVRSSLEMAYTLQLDRRAFNGTMEALSKQLEEVRKEAEEQEKADEERLAALRRQASRQNQNHQMQLSELKDQLHSLRVASNH
jgi:hypothetical protein